MWKTVSYVQVILFHVMWILPKHEYNLYQPEEFPAFKNDPSFYGVYTKHLLSYLHVPTCTLLISSNNIFQHLDYSLDDRPSRLILFISIIPCLPQWVRIVLCSQQRDSCCTFTPLPQQIILYGVDGYRLMCTSIKLWSHLLHCGPSVRCYITN